MKYTYTLTYSDIINTVPVLKAEHSRNAEKAYNDLFSAFWYVANKVTLPIAGVSALVTGAVDLISTTFKIADSDKEVRFKEVFEVEAENTSNSNDLGAGVLTILSMSPNSVSGTIMQRENILSGDNSIVNIIGHIYPKLFIHDSYSPAYSSSMLTTKVYDTFLFPVISKYISMYYESQGNFIDSMKYEDLCIKYISLMNQYDDSIKIAKFSNLGKVVPYDL